MSNDGSLPRDNALPQTKALLDEWDDAKAEIAAHMKHERATLHATDCCGDDDDEDDYAPHQSTKNPEFSATIPIRRLQDSLTAAMASGRHVVLVDLGGNGSVYLRYRDTNRLILTKDGGVPPIDETRLALLGGVRFGKPVVLEVLSELDWTHVVSLFDAVTPGLLNGVLDHSLASPSGIDLLFKPGDPDFYGSAYFSAAAAAAFQLIILTKQPFPPDDFAERFFVLTVS